MSSETPPRSANDGLLAQLATAAVAAPVAIGLTALGALVSAAQWVVATVSDLLPDAQTSRPRHNAKRVREQLDAARRAAEASGVLWSKVQGRNSRKR